MAEQALQADHNQQVEARELAAIGRRSQTGHGLNLAGHSAGQGDGG